MLRLILSPRWIVWHVLTIGAMVTCAYLSAWQWARAGSATGSVLNIGYALQWPAFAIFFGFMWFRMLSMELRRLRSEEADEVHLAEPPDALPERPAAGAPEPDDTAAPAPPPPPSPFLPRPAAAAEPPITDETDPELAAYNRMLAALAERDRAS